MGCGMVITFFTVQACFTGGLPALRAILVSLWNSILPMLSKYCVMNIEREHTEVLKLFSKSFHFVYLISSYFLLFLQDDIDDSFISKTVAARFFCSAIILYIVGLDHSPQVLSPLHRIK